MLRFFLILIVALALMGGLATLMQKDAGYILLSYDKTSIESSLWAGLTALLILFGLLYFGFKLIFKLLYSGRHIRNRMDLRKVQRNHEITAQGLTHFIEGDMQRSLKTFARSTKKGDAPLTNYILAAQAANAMGDTAQSEELLQKAAEIPGTQTAVDIVRARLQYQNGDYAAAKKAAESVLAQQANHKAGLALLARSQEKLQDWSALCDLFPRLQQQKAMPLAELEELKRKTFISALKSADSANVLRKLWDSLPKASKREAALIDAYAQGLAAVGDEVEAESVLRQSLRKEFDETLIERYGLVQGSDTKKQLSTAQRHEADHGSNGALLLCLGRLNRMNGNLDQAKEYLAKSLEARASAAAHAALGNVLAEQGAHEESSAHFQKSLQSDDVLALPSPSEETAEVAEDKKAEA
jgi:HemY protein